MKIFEVDFAPLWPFPYGLVIAATDINEAKRMAQDVLNGQIIYKVTEVDVSKPCVIFFQNGDY